jgi:hypothetical protein
MIPSLTRSLRVLTLVLLCIFITGLHAEPLTHTGLDEGYYDMYNLDFAGAHKVFEAWMQAHPEDPLGPASDAAAFLFTEFDRLGVLDIELFSDEDRFTGRKPPPVDQNIRRSFEQRAAQTDALTAAALKKNPNDARALYTSTMLAGLRSDYAAMIDKKDYAALKYTEQASGFAKKTLAADPTMYDASIAVGVENYMLSLKPGVMRLFFFLRGDSTSKEEGIRQMRLVAEKGHYLAPFARLMLAVCELKDHRPEEARAILTGLAQQFPQNTLYSRQLARMK